MTYAVFAPEIILVAAAMLILITGFFTKRRRAILWGLALGSVILAIILTLDMMGLSITHAIGLNLWSSPIVSADGDFTGQLRLNVDLFALFFHMIFLIVALLVIIASKGYIKNEEPHQAEYYCLMLLAVVGMMFVAAATDLIVIYLAFELSSLSTFALAAFRKKDTRSAEAAMKFFMIGVISSAIILFGISLIYGITGTTSVATLDLRGINAGVSAAIPTLEPPLIVAIVFLIAGFGFKAAVVPFHMWAPDVYEGSPTTISAFLAAGSKKVGILALMKVFLVALLAVQGDWLIAIAILALATMTVANIVAIPQRNVKRMLAYSSIAHVGYILIAIAVGSLLGTAATGTADWYGKLDVASYSLAGGMYHVLTHSIMTVGAFLVVAAASTAKVGETFDDYKGLAKRLPLMSLSLAIFLLSLAGMPPFGGFFSKFVLFSSAVSAGSYNVWFVSLAVAGVLNSALSLYYYARLIWYMYAMEPSRSDIPRVSNSIRTAVVIALIAITLVGLTAQPFISYTQNAARGLLNPVI